MLDESLKKAANHVIGIKQTTRALEKNLVKSVFVAKDAEERVLKPILTMCSEKGLSVTYIETMKELGEKCEIEVGAAVAAILKD